MSNHSQRGNAMRRMMAHQLLRTIGAAVALLFSLSSARAQSVTASITGTVTDPSGAVVTGAHVVARNLSTNVETSATTNDAGSYRIEYLPIGQYVATITAPGFAKASIPAFTLEALQTATFNVK